MALVTCMFLKGFLIAFLMDVVDLQSPELIFYVRSALCLQWIESEWSFHSLCIKILNIAQVSLYFSLILLNSANDASISSTMQALILPFDYLSVKW